MGTALTDVSPARGYERQGQYDISNKEASRRPCGGSNVGRAPREDSSRKERRMKGELSLGFDGGAGGGS